MKINLEFIAKSTPAILVLGGIWFLFLDHAANTNFGFAPWLLIILGVGVSLAWAGFFGRFR